jgi:hypothetical protein
MGKGTDAARAAGAGLHADVIDDLKDQLLIAFLRRAGQDVGNGKKALVVPVQEIDETGKFTLSFSIVGMDFCFLLEPKQ